MSNRPLVAWLLPLLWLFVACHTDALVGALAVRTAEEKKPEVSSTELARHAKHRFRETLYAADFDALPAARRQLTAAYLENPRDPETSLLLAHSHLWALSERSRHAGTPDPQVTDHAILADRYLSEAARLAPDDARIDGWHGAVRLALGALHQDERSTRRGWFQLRRAAREYPAFNGFSAAYPMSLQPRDSERFAAAVEWMWLNLEACTEGRLDRSDFDYAVFMAEATSEGPLRVCWNTDLVPHNFEGFFLAMGDLLTKAGDVENARAAYESAQRSPGYATWRYAGELEGRLVDLEQRAAAFARAKSPEGEPPMMFGSDYACTGCHAR